MSTQSEEDVVTTHELTVSNMIGLGAIVDLWVKKGLVSQEEILEGVAAGGRTCSRRLDRLDANRDREGNPTVKETLVLVRGARGFHSSVGQGFSEATAGSDREYRLFPSSAPHVPFSSGSLHSSLGKGEPSA